MIDKNNNAKNNFVAEQVDESWAVELLAELEREEANLMQAIDDSTIYVDDERPSAIQRQVQLYKQGKITRKHRSEFKAFGWLPI